MNKTDVLVVGTGIVGLSAALAMRKLGYNVVILEKNAICQESLTDVSRVYAINQASELLLTQIGVWSRLDKTQLSLYRHMHVWDARTRAKIDFDARMILADHLGFMVEESILRNIMLDYIKEQEIPIISEYQVKKVIPPKTFSSPQRREEGVRREDKTLIETDSTISVVSSNEKIWSANLLIAADGAHSQVREQLNVPLTIWSYHQQAIVATIRTEYSHQQTAYQVFHAEGPLALLPMPDVYHCSIVWSTTPKEATRLLALSDESFSIAIMQAFGSKLGRIELLSARSSFPLQMRHVQQYAGPGWLLMGDAAHTIHPMAGLGLNVGLADLAAWLKVSEGRHAIWSQRQIGQYQRQRKAALWQIIMMMESLHRLFKNAIPFIIGCRAFGLNLMNHLLPLKRLLIEYATGTR